jgi:orotate phosphoribosyltransferase
MNNEIIKLFYDTPGVVNLSDKDDFEPQPGVFASVYINLKTPLFYPDVRKRLAKLLAENIDRDVDYICGIESGGSYYASSVGDLLNKKVLLFRKEKKQYNVKNNFVGSLPQKGDKVVIVDDVISSGNTISKAVKKLKGTGCKVKAVILFSYGWERQITKNLGIELKVLSNATELIDYGLSIKRMSFHNAQIIRDFVKREEKRLAKL